MERVSFLELQQALDTGRGGLGILRDGFHPSPNASHFVSIIAFNCAMLQPFAELRAQPDFFPKNS
jgi:hypothetical protein